MKKNLNTEYKNYIKKKNKEYYFKEEFKINQVKGKETKQLNIDYINLKSEYEKHKSLDKVIVNYVLFGFISFTVYIYLDFIIGIINSKEYNLYLNENMFTIFTVLTIIIFFLAIIFFILIAMKIKKTNHIYKKMLVYEYVINEREISEQSYRSDDGIFYKK